MKYVKEPNDADERIDKVGSPVLKFGESITIPAYDKAPIDSNKLGIYFSPSKAIDEDIIQSMPNIDFDQYIGDPRDQYKEQYTGLTTARNLYWKKPEFLIIRGLETWKTLI